MSVLKDEICKFDAKSFIDSKTLEIKDFFGRSGARGIIIGLSGGLNSSVATLLCSRAISGRKVHAIYFLDKKSHTQTRMKVINRLATIGRFKLTIIDVTEIYDRLLVKLPPLEEDVKKSELKRIEKSFKARLRTTILYYYSDIHDYIVCGTCDKSEVMLGVFPRWGEKIGDIMPLCSIYKSQVLKVAKEMRIGFTAKLSSLHVEELLSLPTSYDVIDSILLGIEKNWSDEEIADDLGLELEAIRRIREVVGKSIIKGEISKFKKHVV